MRSHRRCFCNYGLTAHEDISKRRHSLAARPLCYQCRIIIAKLLMATDPSPAAAAASATVTVTVRGLAPELKARLRIRAAHNARSMKAEPRAILEVALAAPEEDATDLASFARGLFAPSAASNWSCRPGSRPVIRLASGAKIALLQHLSPPRPRRPRLEAPARGWLGGRQLQRARAATGDRAGHQRAVRVGQA